MSDSSLGAFSLDYTNDLSQQEVSELQSLLAAATDNDGVRPLSEHVWLHLVRGGDDHSEHLLVHNGDESIVGYAHLDRTDMVDGPSAEIVVHPEFRQQGIGHAVLRELVEVSHGTLRLWAHGENSAANGLAQSMGLRRHRVLWQMRRSLHSSIPDPVFPDGIRLESFDVGHDEQAMLDLNSRSFTDLPDQGTWTMDDLQRRQGEDWFDPGGLLMAWLDEPSRPSNGARELAGFHWTKVHGSTGPHDSMDDARSSPPRPDSAQHGHRAIGEVYVLAVAPPWRGSGLGRALTLAGLHHLRRRGLDQVMLYVDASNLPAIRLYEGLGFVRWDTDIMYRTPRS